MRLMTDALGEIEYDENAIIEFKEGLPGFEDAKQYVLVLSDDLELPFHHLQSVDNPNVVFVITSPFLFVEDYDFELNDSVVQKLAIQEPGDLYIYTVVTIPKKVQFSTINLTAPIVINTVNRQGMQVVLEEIDDINHPLFTKKGE